MAPWRHLSTAPAPFAEAAWRHAQQIVARRGTDPGTETEIAQAVAGILARAATGPDDIPDGQAVEASRRTGKTSRQTAAAVRRKDAKKAARARAATPDRRAAPADLPQGDEPGSARPAPDLDRSDDTDHVMSAPRPGDGVLPRHGEHGEDDEVPAVVVPLEIFDARKEARRRW